MKAQYNNKKGTNTMIKVRIEKQTAKLIGLLAGLGLSVYLVSQIIESLAQTVNLAQ